MSDTKLDCTGLPCPQPVLKCRQSVDAEAPARLVVMVDNEPARDNVSRYLGTRGYATTATEAGGIWTVTATAAAAPDAPAPAAECPTCRVLGEAELDRAARTTAVFLTADRMGRGDDELGAKLMGNFLATLPELGPGLTRMILVNSAVKLACEGSPCLDKLLALAEAGVQILVCGTCLGHFGLLERKRVGETTNMLDVVTGLDMADKVIQV
ncbi:MAG: sulfurtransferase-like selenium metabolism protein YedF [Desulfovibrionaceae bacterium]